MEPECSLPCSQQSATGPCLKPDESNPHLPTLFPKIHSNITLPSMPRSSEWPLPLRFSDHHLISISHISHACYMPRQPHPPWFNHSNNNLWSVQVTKLLITQCSPASRHFFPLNENTKINTKFCKTVAVAVLLYGSEYESSSEGQEKQQLRIMNGNDIKWRVHVEEWQTGECKAKC
jgi:hypothetical protein